MMCYVMNRWMETTGQLEVNCIGKLLRDNMDVAGI